MHTTALSILVENNINLESTGGQWLLLMLEEKQEHPDRTFSPLALYRSLMNQQVDSQDEGYKSMMVACKRECDKTGMTVSKFINSAKF